MDVTRIESLRESLRRMAEGSFADAPFYKCLALGMARDDGTLEILSVLPGEPLLGGRLFAAIQYLVLGGGGAELATVWPGIEATSMSTSPDIDKLAVLAGEFLVLHQAELADVMSTRKISQTNEVGRGSYLVQAVSWLGDPAASAVLVEVGASAGLLLNFDRYRYEFGESWFGDSASQVKVRVEQVGERSAPVSDIVRSPSVRVGLDIEPVDIFCDDDLRWLRACIWPDQPERVRRFLAAIDIARTYVPDVRRYDAITGLRTVCDDLSAGTPLLVFHASTLMYTEPAYRKRFYATLEELSDDRRVDWVFCEPAQIASTFGPDIADALASEPTRTSGFFAPLVHVLFDGPRREITLLAWTGPHGAWVEWLA